MRSTELFSLDFQSEYKYVCVYFFRMVQISQRQQRMIENNLKNLSMEVDSQYPEEWEHKKQIPDSVLNKYMGMNDCAIAEYFERGIVVLQPHWSLDRNMLWGNMKSMVTSNWSFPNNASIYLVFWGPLTVILLVSILHSSPFQSFVPIVSCAVVDLGLILITAFAMYIYSNVLYFPHNEYLQHLCVSSYINLITIIYCCICMHASSAIIIVMSIFYVAVCGYFHFNLYNRAIKPTLIEFLLLIVILVGLYTCGAFVFAAFFPASPPPVSKPVSHHLLRWYNHQ